MTKILFIDQDEVSFEFRKCVARALVHLPPIELFRVGDPTEALQLLEQIQPDVLVFEYDGEEEVRFLLDGLGKNHPPLILQHDGERPAVCSDRVHCIPRSESLDGLHQTLLFATSVAAQKEARTIN